MGKRSQSKEGAVEKCKLAEVCVYDSADVLDQAEAEWIKGWETRYKRLKVFDAFKGATVNESNVEQYSNGFYAAPYKNFTLLIKGAFTGSGSGQRVKLATDVSDNGSDWYVYDEAAHSDIYIVYNKLAQYHNLVRSPNAAQYMRVRMWGTGTLNAGNYFSNVIVKLIAGT